MLCAGAAAFQCPEIHPGGEYHGGTAGERVLAIRDTGIGIAPEDLPRIFEKGYTGQNGRADKRASGLGLYLCSRICRNLGIGLTVKSTSGVGTTLLLDFTQYPLRVE